jgi:hypothetical protein
MSAVSTFFGGIAEKCPPTWQSATGRSSRQKNWAITEPKKTLSMPPSKEYIRRRRQEAILAAFGSIEYDPDSNYKREHRERELRIRRG